MTRKTFVYPIILALSLFGTTPATSNAGLLSWMFGNDWEDLSASNMTTRALTKLHNRMPTNTITTTQDPALQIGEIKGKIYNTVVDERWWGDVEVTCHARYSATFGLKYGFIEKALHIEKDYTTTGLVVIVSAPELLSDAAVDTASIWFDADKGKLRPTSAADKLKFCAQHDLTSIARIDAQKQCRGPIQLEMTRNVVRDIVLDMVGDLCSRRLKRLLASRTTVIFEHEVDNNDLKRRTVIPTAAEIDWNATINKSANK